ncbi:acyl-CoA thioesterase-2 [Nitrospirillum viridazoti]|uniref:Acyl-CoA thioesterase II n=2 Tax=Nitrospirillum TaxID=1543705 RepID=A0A248JU15_9PROT|nr:acyl-CoA thioesterase II [Nitrospirillum amazonense CBAmc]TWB31043.1 acyl-CoA thioesterase-2 [Nitrospirillum amazonense]
MRGRSWTATRRPVDRRMDGAIDTNRAAPITAGGVLSLDRLAEGRFRAWHTQANPAGALFGGVVLGQSLAAASATGPGWPAHSLHGYFLRPGRAGQPVDYIVETLRDGRRFAARRVTAQQGGRTLFHMHCSFHEPESGFDHQAPPSPDMPAPEDLIPMDRYVANQVDRLPPSSAAYMAPFPLELRLVEPDDHFLRPTDKPQRAFWLRMPSAAGVEDDNQQRALLAFAADYWLAGVAVGPGRLSTNRDALTINSLDHAMWFHRPVRVDQWLLYVCDTPSGSDGRGLARGLLYDRAGRLVATTSQEALFRATT